MQVQRIPRNLPYAKPNLNELKYADLALGDDNFAVVATATGLLMNGTVQGAAQQQRIGNKISMKSLRIKGNIINLLTAVQTSGRILVVYDKQTNGVVPALTDVINTRTSITAAATTTAYSNLNLDNVERFTILRDMTFILPSVTNTAGVLTNTGWDSQNQPNGSSFFDVDMFIKLKGMTTLYKGATSGIGDIATGGIYMYLINHQGIASWTFRNTIRLRYNDN